MTFSMSATALASEDLATSIFVIKSAVDGVIRSSSMQGTLKKASEARSLDSLLGKRRPSALEAAAPLS